MNAFINYLDKYHGQLTVLLLGLSLIVLAVFLWLWFYNRRKYHHLKHQIPASVVKNYLDSIIQNSTALKSSLFRGGGLDVDSSGVPSVMPLSDLPSGADVNISGGDDDSALRAELSKLQAQLNEKNGVIKDLEDKNAQLGGDVKAKQERIEELEKLLAAAKEAGGGADADPEADAKIAKLQEEKDSLEEDLKQYELIADDIAENKRLKQENAQLKKALEAAGGDVPEAPAEAAEAAAPEPEEAEEEPAAEEPVAVEEESAPAEEQEGNQEEDDMAAVAAAMEEDSSDVEEPTGEAEPEAEAEEPAAQEAASEEPQASEDSEEEDSKSPEDLLSEFEKMLG